ncbi:hypothetical protein DOTSEDRAFT_73733 [Dothistroma septosporum NZE10]|uniref:Nephrocystin 3-like N-terminal domain-containing protein n=1 Tax=Dothistroma septosporum (strain NZE10 / CBS 128990) TaxID=675120 RepID=N1PFM4_DOTSN|nr:hypothetical protein DOTSEDRAFT_73733 [Dothistroma septosporum NZE10]
MAEVLGIVGAIFSIIQSLDAVAKSLETFRTALKHRSRGRLRTIPRSEQQEITDRVKSLAADIEAQYSAGESWTPQSLQKLVEEAANLNKALDKRTSSKQIRHALKLWKPGSTSDLSINVVYIETTINIVRVVQEAEKRRLQSLEDADNKRRSLIGYMGISEWNMRSEQLLNHPTTQRGLLKNLPENYLDFLSDRSYSVRHHRYRAARLPDTGRWFRESKEYQQWKQDKYKRCLWCVGAPGTGKSTVMSEVIDHYIRDKDVVPSFAYYYLGYGKVQSAKDVVQNIFHQLCKAQDDRLSPEVLDSLTRLSSGTELPCHQLGAHLQKSHSNARILLDALDEENMVDAEGLGAVVKMLHDSGCRLIVFSRSDWLSKHVPHDRCLRLEMNAKRNEADMKEFIRSRITPSILLQDMIRKDDRLQNRIEDRLLECSGGKFFLCDLEASRLVLQKTPRDVKERLLDPSDGIDAIINHALDTVLESPENDHLAQRSMTWLCFVDQPMDVSGLCEALTLATKITTPEALPTLDADDILTFEQVLQRCKGLVRGDEASKKALLAHHAIRDKLPALWSTHTRRYMAELGLVCVRYLLLVDFEVGPSQSVSEFRQRLANRPFLEFAACSWLRFLDIEMHGDFARELCSQLICSRPRMAAVAQVTCWCQCEPERREATFEDFLKKSQAMTSLEYAANVGLESILHEDMPWRNRPAWAISAAESTPDDRLPESRLSSIFVNYGSTLLKSTGEPLVMSWILSDDKATARFGLDKIWLYALLRNDRNLAKRLLSRYPESQQHRRHGVHPLTLAMQNTKPSLDIVRDLLEAGIVDFNYEKTPLHVACEKGYVDIAQLLLQYKVLLDSPKDSKSEPPLFLAIRQRHENIVRLLLRHGASIQRTGLVQDTALHCAVRTGDQRLVKLVLANCSDARLTDGQGYLPQYYTKDERIQTMIEFWAQ